MSSTTTEARHHTDAALAEVGRLAAEASHRSVEGARATVEIMRGLFDESTDISRRLFDIWVRSGEATLQATFDIQNATFATSLALFESVTSTQSALLKQWQSAAHDAQQASLDAVRAQVRATSRL
jgi:hypothetical protein